VDISLTKYGVEIKDSNEQSQVIFSDSNFSMVDYPLFKGFARFRNMTIMYLQNKEKMIQKNLNPLSS
jgi:hypothetical protein